jgi:hypothetical protein
MNKSLKRSEQSSQHALLKQEYPELYPVVLYQLVTTGSVTAAATNSFMRTKRMSSIMFLILKVI